MNPNLIGDLLVLIALCFNLLAGLFFFLVARGNKSFEPLARRSYNWFSIFATLILAFLYYLFFTHDYSMKYVFEYSNNDLPLHYLISSLWGGQEGTYVLWLFMSAMFGYGILKRTGQYRDYGMAVFSLVNLFFLFIMVKLSPFAFLDFYASDGAGLNPLLQDPWMVIHPPVMFVGYAVVGVPFAIAMAALIRGNFSSWVKSAMPWVGVAALMLALGNILGGYWAYKTLGWGGFWAWDPVENSSFIPWFLSLSLIHGLVIERRTGALRKTNLLMSALLFISVIYGTFLTRSGVLADFSVHSFVDLGLNIYLVGFLVFYILFALVIFLARVRSMEPIPLKYNFYSKEFSLFGGMMLLFLFSAVVLFWTSLPLLTTMGGEPRAADLSTYNNFALPFAVIYALFLTIAPLLNYNGVVLANWKGKVIGIAVASLAAGFGISYLMAELSVIFAVVFSMVITGISAFFWKSDIRTHVISALSAMIITIAISLLVGVKEPLYLLYFGTAAMMIVTNLISFIGYLPDRWKLAGGQLTHFGFGLMLIGILTSSGFSTSENVVINRGSTESAFGIDITYLGMEHEIEYPKNRLILSLNDGSGDQIANPQLYYSERLDGIMRKPYVKKELLADYYFSPVQIQDMDSEAGLTLTTGESKTVGDYTFTFNGYEMGGGDPSGNSVSVIALVDVSYGESFEKVEPVKTMHEDERGLSKFVDFPADFGPDGKYSMTVEKIQADGNTVLLAVPGLIDSSVKDRLILDVSKKPIINLIWFGTTLILLGGCVVLYRRWSESALA